MNKDQFGYVSKPSDTTPCWREQTTKESKDLANKHQTDLFDDRVRGYDDKVDSNVNITVADDSLDFKELIGKSILRS